MQHRPPAGVRAQPRGPDRPGRKHEPRARGTADATGWSIRSAQPATTNCSGSGTCPTKTTSTPTPITSLGPVRSISVSLTTAVALLETGRDALRCSAPCPEQQALAGQLERAHLRVQAPLPPGGTREFSVPEEATATPPAKSSSRGCGPNPTKSRSRPRKAGKGGKRSAACKARRCPRRAPPSTPRRPRVSGSPATETGKLSRARR